MRAGLAIEVFDVVCQMVWGLLDDSLFDEKVQSNSTRGTDKELKIC